MKTKYYVDLEGNYLGGFSGYKSDDGFVYATPPNESVEISEPPSHGWQKYDHANKTWFPLNQEQKQLLGV